MYTRTRKKVGPRAAEAALIYDVTGDMRHKHLKLDQRKIDFARRYFNVKSEQEAIDRALSMLMDEEQIASRLEPLAGALRGDKRPWPFR